MAIQPPTINADQDPGISTGTAQVTVATTQAVVNPDGTLNSVGNVPFVAGTTVLNDTVVTVTGNTTTVDSGDNVVVVTTDRNVYVTVNEDNVDQNFITNNVNNVGGSDTEIQYNDAGNFAGDSTFTFDKVTKVVSASAVSTDNLLYANGDPWTFGGGGNTPPGGLNGQLQFNDAGIFNGVPGTSYAAGKLNLGANSAVAITGGTSGQVLTTDGAGNLSWSSPASSYGNADVAAYLPTYTGNVAANWLLADYVSGNGNPLYHIPGGNVVGTVANANYAAFANIAEFANNVAVDAVNNNYSYHVVLTTGPGDSTLHNDADDNLQYNPADGILTVTRVDASYLVGNIAFSSGYPAANVTGLGNIATTNYDGNGSNVLRGNGTWGPDSVSSYGDSNVTSLLGSFGSNAISTTGNVAAGNVTVTGNILPSANITYDIGSPTQRFKDLWLSGSTLHLGNISLNVSNAGELSVSEIIQGGEGIGGISYIEWTTSGALSIRTEDTSPFINTFLSLKKLDTLELLTGSSGSFPPNTVVTVNGAPVMTTPVPGYNDFEIPVTPAAGANTFVYLFNLTRSPITEFEQLSGDIVVNDLNVGGNVTSNLTPNSNVTLDLGSSTQRWKDIWLANSTIHMGDATISANGNGIVVDSITVTNGNVGTIGNIASLNLDGSSSNVLYGNGVFAPAGGGGGGNLGNLQVTGTTIGIAGGATETAITIGANIASMTVDTDSSVPKLNLQVQSTDGQYYQESFDYTSGTWVVNGLEGTLTITGYSPSFETFLNRLGQYQSFTITINGSETTATNGYSWGGGNATFFTLLPPSVDPTNVSNINFNLVFSNKLLMDPDEGDMGIYIGDFNFEIESQRDVRIAAGDDFSIRANDGFEMRANSNFGIIANYNNTQQNWSFLATGNLDIPGNINFAGDPSAAPKLNNFFGVTSAVNFEITTNTAVSNLSWVFDNTGNLVLPSGNSVIYSTANSSLDPINPNVSTMTLTPDANYSSQVLVLDPTSPGHIHLRAPSATGNIDEPMANLFLGGEASSFEIGASYGGAPNVYVRSNNNTWTFDNTGNITVPGLPGTYIKSPANGYIGLAAIDDGTDLPAQLVSIPANASTGTTAISVYANSAQIQTDIAGNMNTWVFDNSGTLTIPGNLVANGASPAPTLSGFSSLSAADVITTGNANIYSNGHIAADSATFTGNISANNLGNISSINTDGNASNILFGNGVFAAVPAATTMDITDTNGLATTFYPTFVENRTTGQTVRADQDLTYRTDTNTLTVGNISANTNGFAIGYRDIPQVAASNTILALDDAGKHYYSTTAGNLTLTIPNNATTSFATGTAISIVVQAAGNILVNADSGVTLYMAGNSTPANRVVGAYGMATLMKVASDTWFINGTGVS